MLIVSNTLIEWATLPASIADGTTDFATLHWNGTSWVENTALSAGATDTTATVNNDIALNAGNAISLQASDTISLTATTTISGGSFTATASGEVDIDATTDIALDAQNNIDISATQTLTLTAGNAISLTSTTTLDAALVDASGQTGQSGYLLSSTATGTKWISPIPVVQTLTTSGTINSDTGIVFLNPAEGVDITITLPDASAVAVGTSLRIKRNNETSGTIILSGGGGIDTETNINMNPGWQAFSLISDGTTWTKF